MLGNPTEGALLLWLWKQGIDYSAIRESVIKEEELPFSTERKYMATVIRSADGTRILYVKGAPEIVFSLCRNYPAGITRETVDAQLLCLSESGHAHSDSHIRSSNPATKP